MKTIFLSREEMFLHELNKTIFQYLDDPELSVTKLLKKIGMSRTDLHRKLSKTTGMSTTEYVRHLRLKKAANLLLENPHWSIYQIALEVGFQSQSYFNKKFKKAFQCTPVAYRKQKASKLESTIFQIGTYVSKSGTSGQIGEPIISESCLRIQNQ